MIISTADFLDATVPEGNRYIGFTNGKTNKAGRPLINCAPVTTGREGELKGLNKQGEDVYFALASFKVARVYDEKNGYMKSFRRTENVEALKAVWLDVDFKQYDSQEAATKDIGRFRKESQLPEPTFIVYSGGGVHLYWVFEAAMPPGDWLPLARGLAGLGKKHGLKADYEVTLDSARVLRLPGTRNQKYDKKPLCKVIHRGNYVDLQEMTDLLMPHSSGATGDPGFLNMPDNVRRLVPGDNYDLGANYQSNTESKFAAIAKECGVVKDSLERGGLGDDYYLWQRLIHLAAYTVDGAEFIHPISNKDPRYKEDDVLGYFNASLRTRDDKDRNVGPTGCDGFRPLAPDKCNACPHLGKIKTPWLLGVTERESVDKPTTAMQGKTVYVELKQNEDGEWIRQYKTLVDWEMRDVELIPSTDSDSQYVMRFTAINGETTKTIEADPDTIADTKKLQTHLFKRGVTVPDSTLKKTKEMLMAWAHYLLQRKAIGVPSKFGWNEDATSFTIGHETLYGDHSLPVMNRNKTLADKYVKKGDPEPWRKLAQRLLDSNDTSLTYLLCAGFAGPLMGILGQRGSLSLSAFSVKSGAGKTTVLKTIMAAFGHPRQTMALSDTSNFVNEVIGGTPGLPAMWDEIRGDDAATRVTEVMFTLSQGKTKGRLDANSNVKEQHFIDAMFICGSNTPLSEYVAQKVKSSDAGMARFLEIEMQPKGGIDNEVATLVGQLEGNYGHFGRDYLQLIIRNYATLVKAEAKILKDLNEKSGFVWPANSRFWQLGTAKILLAGHIMNKTGQLNVDIDRLRAFALDVIRTQQAAVIENQSQPQSLLHRFMREQASHTLITDKFAPRGHVAEGDVPRVEKAPELPGVTVHIAIEEGLVRLDKPALYQFCSNDKSSYGDLERWVIEAEARQKRFVLRTLTLGAKTRHAVAAKAPCLELKLETIGGKEAISFWTPGSGSPSRPSSPAMPGS